MIKGNATSPRVYPWNSSREPSQIDRLTELSGDVTINQEKLYEVGRALKLGVHKLSPSTPITITQNEYLSMKFWRDLANKADPVTGGEFFVDLDDLKGSKVDISASYVDEDETFKGTVYFSKMRVGGFSFNIGDPNAKIVRSFNLVGEYCKLIIGNYLAYASGIASGASLVITFGGTNEPPSPLEDVIFRVLRIRDGVLSEVTTYTYLSNSLTVTGCEVGDLIKVYYPSATEYTTLWQDDNDVPKASYAEQCDIYLRVGNETGQTLYRIQSVNIDVSFDRTDYKEIGNKEIVQTGVRSKTVTVTLGRILEDFTLEQILANLVSPGDSKIIDIKELADTIGLVIKVYTDDTKENPAYGIRIDNLSPTTLKPLSASPEEMNSAENALESDNFLVTDDIDDLGL